MYLRAKSFLYRLLRRSERYTQLDMVYFASGGFWQAFGQTANSIIALLLVLAFANYLPKETYGTYRYLISLAGLLNVFTLTGMNQAVAQAVARGERGVLRTTVAYQIKWNMLLMLVFLLAGGYYLSHANFSYTWALIALGLSIPLTNAFTTYGAYLSGRREFRLSNVLSVLSTLIYAVGMLVAIFASGGVIWLVVAYAATTFIGSAISYLIVLQRFNETAAPAPEVLRYGRYLTAIGLLGPIASQIDSVILNHFWGPAALAVYAIAMTIPNRAIPFFKSFVDVGSPKLVLKTREEIDRTFWPRIGYGALAGIAVGAIYALLVPYLFRYLLPQYLDAVFYTQLLAINFVFALPNRYLTNLLTAQHLTKRIFATNIVQNVISIALYVGLGVWGGILGLVIAQIVNSVLGLFVSMSVWRFRTS